MHKQEMVHGDFKPRNIVRMPSNGLALIDFDASAKIGDPVGNKWSSGMSG
jgi:aminoglycoside phosphotransferase (APT) family kinase protein